MTLGAKRVVRDVLTVHGMAAPDRALVGDLAAAMRRSVRLALCLAVRVADEHEVSADALGALRQLLHLEGGECRDVEGCNACRETPDPVAPSRPRAGRSKQTSMSESALPSESSAQEKP